MAEWVVATIRNLLIAAGLIAKPEYLFRLISEHPVDDEIESGIIYVVGGKGYQKWAYFRCPTDKSEIIQLSLMQKHRPCWRVSSDWLRRPTIYPSVRQTAGSFAHFWMAKGRVSLCADSGAPPRQDWQA